MIQGGPCSLGDNEARHRPARRLTPLHDPLPVELSLIDVKPCPIEELMSDVEKHGSCRRVVGVDGCVDTLMR